MVLYRIVNGFTKITGWLIQKIIFRTEIRYEDRTVQGRNIKGAAILASNHTSVFDYAAFLFVFFSRTLRYQMAEVLFHKKPLGPYLRMMGGIMINRDSTDYSFLWKSTELLEQGSVVGIFPEGRLPRDGEKTPLDFKTGAAFLSLQTGVPVIPVYTNGAYFTKKRCVVVIGKPISPSALDAADCTDKEKIERLTTQIREAVIKLGQDYGA